MLLWGCTFACGEVFAVCGAVGLGEADGMPPDLGDNPPSHSRADGIRRRQRAGGLDLGPGSSLPAYCTALGKVLLAYLPEYERQELLSSIVAERRAPNTITSKGKLREELAQVLDEGFAVEDEELADGRIAIAAPVLDEASEIAAAIDMSAQTPSIALEELASGLGPHLISTADRISARLGYRRPDETGGRP